MCPDTRKWANSIPAALHLKIVHDESGLGEFFAVARFRFMPSGHSGDHHLYLFSPLFAVLFDRDIIAPAQNVDILFIAGDLTRIAVLIV